MAVGPNHGDCVVALLLDLAGEDHGVDLLFLHQHGAAEFVDADCTPT